MTCFGELLVWYFCHFSRQVMLNFSAQSDDLVRCEDVRVQ